MVIFNICYVIAIAKIVRCPLLKQPADCVICVVLNLNVKLRMLKVQSPDRVQVRQSLDHRND
jgi:hypothetical protein